MSVSSGGRLEKIGYKIRSRSPSPIRVSPSRPVIFGNETKEEALKVTLTLTPPTPSRNQVTVHKSLVYEPEEDSWWHNVDLDADADELEAYGSVALLPQSLRTACV